MLRDRIARALPAWSRGMPGYHAVLGMHAFGLEECGDYARAEAQGRAGVELEPRDGWAQHAVAHVMEMQGRERDGIAWMRADPAAWSTDSFFRVHNWWHLALYHLELGEIDEVLALYDGPIRGERSTVILDMIDASAMLWRLHLRGIDVGTRWERLAEDWAPFAAAGNYAFNEVHATLAFVGAGREDLVDTVLAAQDVAMAGEGDNAVFTREVGRPLTLAMRAFGAGRHVETVRLIRASVRRQPRAAQPARPDADRGRAARRPAGARPRAVQRARRRPAAQSADPALAAARRAAAGSGLRQARQVGLRGRPARSGCAPDSYPIVGGIG